MIQTANFSRIPKSEIPSITYPDMSNLRKTLLNKLKEPEELIDGSDAEDKSEEEQSPPLSPVFDFRHQASRPPVQHPLPECLQGSDRAEPIVDQVIRNAPVVTIPKPDNYRAKIEDKRGRKYKASYVVKKVVGENDDGLEIKIVGYFSSIQKIADHFESTYGKMYRIYRNQNKTLKDIIIEKLDKN